jgi:hypothetical protein
MMRTSTLAFAVAATLVPAGAMSLSSGDFQNGAALPQAHVYPRCGGQNVSPGFTWSGAPERTRSFVFTMIDHSVTPNYWSHWIVADLAPDTMALAHGLTALPARAMGVKSNFGEAKYDGPCPPHGTGVHRYIFTIWAMPAGTTTIPPDAKGKDVEGLLSKTALAHASIEGTVAAK